MNDSPNIIGNTGLKFFGKISASISHELKNVLAIINESAGLLDDLTMMAEKGVPLDPLRLKTTTKRIHMQVGRADKIIQNMNRFSHSIDRDVITFDVHELLTTLLALTNRLTDMKGVSVDLAPTQTSIMLTASPFFLKTLLWRLLDFAMGMLEKDKTIRISVAKPQHDVEIHITHLGELQTSRVNDFPGETELALINSFGGKLSFGNGNMLLTLPSGDQY